MSLFVPGVGNVNIRWMPASDEDFKDKSEGARSGYQPIAIVHHRGVVNTIGGLNSTFAHGDTDPATVGSPGRPVSSNFGVGDSGMDGMPVIVQYVDVSDTAYGNGDCQQTHYPGDPSNWDKWYGHKGHNERTVSIEHDDNGGASDPSIKGIVTEAIVKTSIALDRLLLSGDIAAMRAAGIHIRDQATADALGKIVPGPKTLIDHHDIAGRLKPSCWKPWSGDKIGFPRTRYINELTTPIPAPPKEDDMPALSAYLPGQTVTVKTGMRVRTGPKLTAATARITASAETWTIIGLVTGDLDTDCNGTDWVVRWNPSSKTYEYTSKCNLSAGPADLTPYSKAQVDAAVKTATDPLIAKITAEEALAADVSTQLSALAQKLAI